MSIITVNENGKKNIEEAVKLLKENGFDVSIESPLRKFLKEEADFRLDNNLSLNDEQQLLYNNMSPEKQEFISSVVADAYFDSECIFDYEAFDEIARRCFDCIVEGV